MDLGLFSLQLHRHTTYEKNIVMYCEIPTKNKFLSVKFFKLLAGWIFQKNNDPKHTTVKIRVIPGKKNKIK